VHFDIFLHSQLVVIIQVMPLVSKFYDKLAMVQGIGSDYSDMGQYPLVSRIPAATHVESGLL
jgi:hypothetical protein